MDALMTDGDDDSKLVSVRERLNSVTFTSSELATKKLL